MFIIIIISDIMPPPPRKEPIRRPQEYEPHRPPPENMHSRDHGRQMTPDVARQLHEMFEAKQMVGELEENDAIHEGGSDSTSNNPSDMRHLMSREDRQRIEDAERERELKEGRRAGYQKDFEAEKENSGGFGFIIGFVIVLALILYAFRYLL